LLVDVDVSASLRANWYEENSSLQVGETFFLREEKVSMTKRDQDGQQQAELKKTLQKFVKCI